MRVLLDKYRDNLVLGVLTTSVALLIGALLFEHVGGLKPCNLCLMQRYAHIAVIVMCLESLAAKNMSRKKLAHVVGFASSLSAAGVAFFHAGVEMDLWEGLSSCSGQSEDISLMSGSDLLSFEGLEPIVMCSDIAWSMAGVSMAGWNGIITLAASTLWIFSLRKLRTV
jgi:disulfide bond formation protein DsbB